MFHQHQIRFQLGNEAFFSDDFMAEALFKENSGFCEWVINYSIKTRKLVRNRKIRSESNCSKFQEKINKLNKPAKLLISTLKPFNRFMTTFWNSINEFIIEKKEF